MALSGVEDNLTIKNMQIKIQEMLEYYQSAKEYLIKHQNSKNNEEFNAFIRELFPKLSGRLRVEECILAVIEKVKMYDGFLKYLKINKPASTSALLFLANIYLNSLKKYHSHYKNTVTNYNMEFEDGEFIESIKNELESVKPDGFELLKEIFVEKDEMLERRYTGKLMYFINLNKMRDAIQDFSLKSCNIPVENPSKSVHSKPKPPQDPNFDQLYKEVDKNFSGAFSELFENLAEFDRQIAKVCLPECLSNQESMIFKACIIFYQYYEKFKNAQANIERIYFESEKNLRVREIERGKEIKKTQIKKIIDNLNGLDIDYEKRDLSFMPPEMANDFLNISKEMMSFRDELISDIGDLEQYLLENCHFAYEGDTEDSRRFDREQKARIDDVRAAGAKLNEKMIQTNNDYVKIKSDIEKRIEKDKQKKQKKQTEEKTAKAKALKQREELYREKQRENLSQWRSFCEKRKEERRSEKLNHEMGSSSLPVQSLQQPSVLDCASKASIIFDSLGEKSKNLIRRIVFQEKGVKFEEVKNLIVNKLEGEVLEIGNGSSHKRIVLENFGTLIGTVSVNPKQQDKGKEKKKNEVKGTMVKNHGKAHQSDELSMFSLSRVSELFIKVGFTKESVNRVSRESVSRVSSRPSKR